MYGLEDNNHRCKKSLTEWDPFPIAKKQTQNETNKL